MNENPTNVHSHPLIGAAIGFITGASGITVMQFTQGVVSITAGLLTICLLILQIRKALKS